MSRRTAPHRPRPLYAPCDTGLEQVLADELRALGASDVKPGHRGVHFVGDRHTLWRVNLASRVANRVLMPVAEFPCRTNEDLYDGIYRVNWGAWFDTRRSIAFDASSHRSTLSHTGYLAQLAKDALCDRFREETGRRPNVDRRSPDIPINVRVSRDHCVVSLDASGPRLHKRGYRTESGAAPLKETLAAGILAMTGWTPEQPLVDPMCGAGTFVLEAGLIATNTAPGLLRLGRRRPGFAFMRWLDHDQAAFDKLLVEFERAIVRPEVIITGSDTDLGVLGVARRNAERADLEGIVSFTHQPLSAAAAPEGSSPGVVVVNPPYGERLGRGDDLSGLYVQLGDTFKQRFSGWEAWVLAGNEAPIKKVGLRPASKTPLRNGPIQCTLSRYPLYRGSKPA